MAENKALIDILPRKEMSDLLCQNVAIRSQTSFLIKRLSNLSMQSDREVAPSNELNKRISLYCYLLVDFRETLMRHIGLCEHIEKLYGHIFSQELIVEQKEVEQQLDSIIWVIHYAAYHGLQRDELNRCASDIIERVSRICELVNLYMTKEERALKYTLVNVG